MTSAEHDSSTPDEQPQTGLSPLEGGPWRPVKPDELLRRNPGETVEPGGVMSAENQQAPPRVHRERRQELEHHLRQSPTDQEAYLELAHIYRAENKPAEARRILQQAVEIFPDDGSIRWELEEAVLARSLQQLREVSELAGRLDTVETEHELERSKADWAARRIEVCRARLERMPSRRNLRVSLAEALFDASEYNDSITELDKVLDDDEWSPSAYLLRGRCLIELGKDVEAMKALRAAALRRAVVGPLPVRINALRLLCHAAERLGLLLTLEKYQQHLAHCEQELAKSRNSSS
ncbi:MAG: tetratricopeptide repeat protein [Planctomycetota bacterium]